MFTRACDACGDEYEAKRQNSRFCSGRCRKRSHRGASAKPAEVVSLDTYEPGDVEAATAVALAAVDLVDSVRGRAALALARRLDAGKDTGAGMASLVKQLEATVDTALSSVQTEADPLDELRARRDSKRSAAS